MNSRYKNQGFTLIEVLISIAVLTIGIVTALGLAISNFNNNRENTSRVMAANLAREGIELIRNLRDSNWLKIDSNNVAYCGGSICNYDEGLTQTNLIYIDYLDDLPDLQSRTYTCLSDLSTCTTDCVACALYKNASGFLDHHNSGAATNMKRLVALQQICTDLANSAPEDGEYLVNMTSDCNVGDSPVGINVTSNVQWTKSNGSKDNYAISERLYNWRR